MKWKKVKTIDEIPIGSIWCHAPTGPVFYLRISKTNTAWEKDDTVGMVSVCIQGITPEHESELFQTSFYATDLYLYVGD